MKEAAAALGLSPRTIETHKYQAMEALGLETTAELSSATRSSTAWRHRTNIWSASRRGRDPISVLTITNE